MCNIKLDNGRAGLDLLVLDVKIHSYYSVPMQLLL
jgi:hypothetical protein